MPPPNTPEDRDAPPMTSQPPREYEHIVPRPTIGNAMTILPGPTSTPTPLAPVLSLATVQPVRLADEAAPGADRNGHDNAEGSTLQNPSRLALSRQGLSGQAPAPVRNESQMAREVELQSRMHSRPIVAPPAHFTRGPSRPPSPYPTSSSSSSSDSDSQPPPRPRNTAASQPDISATTRNAFPALQSRLDAHAPSEPRDTPASSHSTTPPLDWSSLTYLDKYDENLDCPICRSPLVEPRLLKCGHIFCGTCLRKHLTQKATCPIDRKKVDRVSGAYRVLNCPLIIQSQLDNLFVSCPNARCTQELRRSSIQHHYDKDCHFTKIPCPDAACDKLVARADCRDGLCAHKPISCEYCRHVVERADLYDHYRTGCVPTTVYCNYCKRASNSQVYDEHLTQCKMAPCECPFKAGGCAFVETRNAIGNHTKTCVYGLLDNMRKEHCKDINEMQCKLDATQEHIQKLSVEVTSLRAYKESREAADGPGNRGDWGGDLVPTLRGQLHLYDARIESMNNNLCESELRQNRALAAEIHPIQDQIRAIRNESTNQGIILRRMLEFNRIKANRGAQDAAAAGQTNNPASGLVLSAFQQQDGAPSAQNMASQNDAPTSTAAPGAAMPVRRMSDQGVPRHPPRL